MYVVGHIVLYLAPILQMCFYLNNYYDIICEYDTPYSGWIFTEVQMFVCWILSTLIFLLFAYICKYRSVLQTFSNKT